MAAIKIEAVPCCDNESLVEWQSSYLELPIKSASPAAMVAYVDEIIDQRPLKLAFVNGYTAYLASLDQTYRMVLKGFMLLNDGLAINLIRLIECGDRFPHNLNGTDFIPFYLQTTRNKYKVFYLGGRPGVAARAARVLQGLAPTHECAGCADGFFNAEELPKILEIIEQSGADCLIVALGNPSQEAWIAKHAPHLQVRIAIGVGALFDFLSGEHRRAPHLARKLRLEWLCRLCREPGRLWQRYLLQVPSVLVRASLWRMRRRA